MENITIQKSSLVAAYRAGNEEQKQMLEQLCGKEVFAINWHDVTSYEKACGWPLNQKNWLNMLANNL